MRISRIYLPISCQQIDNSFDIEGSKAHYIRSVLRLKPGQQLTFFISDGNEYTAKIKEVHKHKICLHQIGLNHNKSATSSLNTTIIQCISSSNRMDYCIQKAAELGCNHLIPVFSDHCSTKISQNKYDKKLKHWQSIAISACEQSGRCDILEIKPIKNLHDIVDSFDSGLFMDTDGKNTIAQLTVNRQQMINVFIGPEGGFSDNEIRVLKNNNYLDLKMGQRILRTETAAVVILSALHTLFGDFTK
ncbi:MAG: 16S rRNA (uracil(1498)-N(3))-methyltransferase [Proteobacteria bacterium]|nr:16S rRNA (uracil(1498)-N(3))-methyltransferase [Pseudomonadota bacterium]